MYQWRTEESGLIVVTKSDGTEFVPTLTNTWATKADGVLARWKEETEDVAETFGLSVHWLRSMVYQESGGNPKAFRQEPNGWTGIGLLQITSPALKAGYTDEQLYDPITNLRVGARYIRNIAGRAEVQGDFVKVSASFNAGSVKPSTKNEWGMVCYGSHIDSEVSCQNYYVLRAMADVEREAIQASRLQFNLLDVVRAEEDESRPEMA